MHYLVALELVGDNARFRAMILGELGLLHTDVGNYRIALGYLLERDKLPYTDNSEGLDVLLSKAQALLHVGREADAAAAGDAALAMIARNPALAPYRLLALDWAAVDNLAAGHFARALALYDQEIPLLDASRSPLGRAESDGGARLAGGGGGRRDAARVARSPISTTWSKRLDDPKTVATLPVAARDRRSGGPRVPAHRERPAREREPGARSPGRGGASHRRAPGDPRGAAQGDEAGGDRAGGDARGGAARVEREPASRRARPRGVWLGRALARADDLRARANGVSDREQLDVLWLAAELTVSMAGDARAGSAEADRGGVGGDRGAPGAFAAIVRAVVRDSMARS